MTPTPFLLVLVAAVMHALWNAMAKRGRDKFLFLWCSASIATVFLLPAIVVDGIKGDLPNQGWTYVCLSIPIHVVYFYALGRAYTASDYSLAYPLARGLGVGLTCIGAYYFLDEKLSIVGIAGICLIVTGIFVVGAFGRTRRASIKTKVALFWPLLTGILIGFYSTNDKAGVGYFSPLAFCAFICLGSMLILAPVALRQKQSLSEEWRVNKKMILLSAFCNLGAYPLVLFAFQMAKTGYVVAGREMSIIFSVLIGAIWLKESKLAVRLTGAAAILCGVVLITLS
jgi:drug/metabolite transporter (DMT)-like permease